MKHVLILCDQFPPAFGPRMGYLCKYLKQNGWHPTVVSEYLPDETFAFLKGDTDVSFIRYHRSGSRVEWLKVLLLELFFGYKNRRMAQEAEKKLEQQRYDVLLCSTYRSFPLPAAQKIARKYRLPIPNQKRQEGYQNTEGQQEILQSKEKGSIYCSRLCKSRKEKDCGSQRKGCCKAVNLPKNDCG